MKEKLKQCKQSRIKVGDYFKNNEDVLKVESVNVLKVIGRGEPFGLTIFCKVVEGSQKGTQVRISAYQLKNFFEKVAISAMETE